MITRIITIIKFVLSNQNANTNHSVRFDFIFFFVLLSPGLNFSRAHAFFCVCVVIVLFPSLCMFLFCFCFLCLLFFVCSAIPLFHRRGIHLNCHSLILILNSLTNADTHTLSVATKITLRLSLCVLYNMQYALCTHI